MNISKAEDGAEYPSQELPERVEKGLSERSGRQASKRSGEGRS